MMKHIVGVAALMIVNTQVSMAQDKVIVSPVSKFSTTLTGQSIQLPPGEVEVNVSVYDIPPHAALPEHRHPYPRYGYVMSGKLRVSNTETGKTSEFSAGQFIVESINQWHKGENHGDERLKLLVIDQSPKGATNVEAKKN